MTNNSNTKEYSIHTGDKKTRRDRMHKNSKGASIAQRLWTLLLGKKVRVYNSVTGRTTFIRVR